jgi:hypothetical protein
MTTKRKTVWGIALKDGTLQTGMAVFGKRSEAEDAIAKISHMSDGFEAVELDPVSYPPIPDSWVACSDRMPEEDEFVLVWPLPDFGVELHVGQYCKYHKKGSGWYAQVSEQNYGIEWYPINVTHWQPLPSPPTTEK